MAQLDRFAEIAQQAHPFSKDEMAPDGPLPIEVRYFQESTQQAAPLLHESYEQQLARFRSDLAALKARYAPFLADHTPPAALTRRRWQHEQFAFRYETAADKADFAGLLSGRGEWETVRIPDYRGPIGRWTGFYRRSFVMEQLAPGKRIFLRFLGVDYTANVYLNGRHVGSHEGFFAPFEFDVTDVLHPGAENVLLVVVQNDAPTIGLASWDSEQRIDGDKIYAATGPGWDDPIMGWHHCPPGAGIYNRVYMEERSSLFVNDIFVRPNLDTSSVEVWVEVTNSEYNVRPFDLAFDVHPSNFEGVSLQGIRCTVDPAGPGANFYRAIVPLPDARLWTPETPWLYTLRATVAVDGRRLDQRDSQFGMRTFLMDEAPDARGQRGTLYLNGAPVILRGANEMGHLQLCVMRGDMDQLVEDILIAKLANMNYYRLTQRPVQDEIYACCDRLGVMNQTDLPLFGYLRRNQFNEAVRQAGEMERLIRSHPSAIMVSYLNEPFSADKEQKGHRDLYRNELEAFFESATRAVHQENPDRVVKNVEGDYDPPTRNGLSDFHTYNMWYTNHALPIGKLHRGYLPALRRGWKTGCGEYGAEGLDPLAVMLNDYPQDWVPSSLDQPWTPEKIVRSQSYTMHGDWYEEQHTITDWINESQRHQALATRMITDALRRRSDRIVSTAVHLLIDAWPSGWMKTLVDHRRTPKPAFFAFQASLAPLRVNLRTDRLTFYSGEIAAVEAWVLNDTGADVRGCSVVATVRQGQRAFGSFEIALDAPAAAPTYAGSIRFTVPPAFDRSPFSVDASLLDADGHINKCESLELEAFAPALAPAPAQTVMYVGDGIPALLARLGLRLAPFVGGGERPDRVLCASLALAQQQRDVLQAWAIAGSRIVVLCDQDTDTKVEIAGLQVALKPIGGGLSPNALTFVARDAAAQLTRQFKPRDFSYWYNAGSDCIDFVAERTLDCAALTPLVFTYRKPGFFEMTHGTKVRLPVVGSVAYGKGEFIFSTLCLPGRVGFNPVLDRFLRALALGISTP